jgi:hypothetical protein
VRALLAAVPFARGRDFPMQIDSVPSAN